MRLHEILLEAKTVFDARHENKEKEIPYFGSQKANYINPEDGFYFVYHGGEMILASTTNDYYSAYVVYGKNSPAAKFSSRAWNQLGGLVNLKEKTITISKENVDGKSSYRSRIIKNIKELKSVLKSLKPYGVTDDFKIKGAKDIPNKVSEVLQMSDHTENLLSNNPDKKIILYHGTSLSRWEKIQKEGLHPNKTGEEYVDLVKGYSEYNVYLATSPNIADFYGRRQAKKDNDFEYVILQVEVPDPAKLRQDDYYARGGSIFGIKSFKLSINDAGQVGYMGKILPKFIKLYKTKNI